MKKNTKGKDKKKKCIGRVILRIILVILLIAIIGYGIWFAINFFKHKTVTEEYHYDPLSATALGIDPEKLKTVGRINLLVLGESGIGDGYKLTDSIMIVSYNPQTQQASLLSIPRDTYIGKKDRNSATQNYLMSYKMNAAYRNGENIPETVERVSELTGVDIDNYILIDTDAIIKIVDAIGGVTFNVPIDMDYDDGDSQDLHIHLQAGEQLIDGPKAEQLLRFRHNNDGTSYPEEYGDNDLGRMRTQREFIKETLKQLVRFENVTKFLDIFSIVFDNIKTDLTMDTAKYYIPYAFKFDMENIVSDFVPGTPELCNGVWIYVANKAETKEVVEALFTDAVPTETSTQETTNNTSEQTATQTTNTSSTTNKTSSGLKVELLNGTETTSITEKIKEKLEKEGYQVTKTGQTTSTSNSLIINRTMQSNTEQDKIKNVLSISNLSSSSNNSGVDFTVIIGKDYK